MSKTPETNNFVEPEIEQEKTKKTKQQKEKYRRPFKFKRNSRR